MSVSARRRLSPREKAVVTDLTTFSERLWLKIPFNSIEAAIVRNSSSEDSVGIGTTTKFYSPQCERKHDIIDTRWGNTIRSGTRAITEAAEVETPGCRFSPGEPYKKSQYPPQQSLAFRANGRLTRPTTSLKFISK